MLYLFNILLLIIAGAAIIFLIYNYLRPKRGLFYGLGFIILTLAMGTLIIFDIVSPEKLPLGVNRLARINSQSQISNIFCLDRMQYPCGRQYQNVDGRPCLGMACPENQTCRQSDGQYQCLAECAAIDETCRTDSDCCSGNCQNGLCREALPQNTICLTENDCSWFLTCHNQICVIGKKIYFFIGLLIFSLVVIFINYFGGKKRILYTVPGLIVLIIILGLSILAIINPDWLKLTYDYQSLSRQNHQCLTPELTECGQRHRDFTGDICSGIACPAGQFCQNNFCLDCRDDGQNCENNSQCCSDFCYQKQCRPLQNFYGSCSVDTDCPKGHICHNSGKCALGNSGTPCLTNYDCAENYSCIDGQCQFINPFNECQYDEQCPQGHACLEPLYYTSAKENPCFAYKDYLTNLLFAGEFGINKKICLANEKVCFCHDNNDCPLDQYCNTGRRNFCTLGAPGNPCVDDSQCLTGICHSARHTCTTGSTGENCRNNGDCRQGLRCQNNLCQYN